MDTSASSTPLTRTPDDRFPWIIVVAHALNRVIGRTDGSLPWRLPSDLRRLRALTIDHAVVMGRVTYETLPRPLDRRLNIVISRDANWHDPDHPEVVHAACIDEAAARHTASEYAGKPLIILGGAKIYELALPRVGVIERTLVEDSPDAEVIFPPINEDNWSMEFDEPHPSDERHSAPYRFQRLVRTSEDS